MPDGPLVPGIPVWMEKTLVAKINGMINSACSKNLVPNVQSVEFYHLNWDIDEMIQYIGDLYKN